MVLEGCLRERGLTNEARCDLDYQRILARNYFKTKRTICSIIGIIGHILDMAYYTLSEVLLCLIVLWCGLQMIVI